jgi:hypothetical protein
MGVKMAKVKVTIKLFMEIPKSWRLVKHSEDKILMDIGDGNFLDMAFTPMIAKKVDGATEWTTDYDEDFAKTIVDKVSECKIKMERM